MRFSFGNEANGTDLYVLIVNYNWISSSVRFADGWWIQFLQCESKCEVNRSSHSLLYSADSKSYTLPEISGWIFTQRIFICYHWSGSERAARGDTGGFGEAFWGTCIYKSSSSSGHRCIVCIFRKRAGVCIRFINMYLDFSPLFSATPMTAVQYIDFESHDNPWWLWHTRPGTLYEFSVFVKCYVPGSS